MSDKPAPARPDRTHPKHAEAGTDGARTPSSEVPDAGPDSCAGASERAREIGGRGGLDPTRYGDWEKNGRCIDF
jgi:hypothetical protein